jgi:hypothetical protein
MGVGLLLENTPPEAMLAANFVVPGAKFLVRSVAYPR